MESELKVTVPALLIVRKAMTLTTFTESGPTITVEVAFPFDVSPSKVQLPVSGLFAGVFVDLLFLQAPARNRQHTAAKKVTLCIIDKGFLMRTTLIRSFYFPAFGNIFL